MEAVGGTSRPQAQGVDCVVAVARNGSVVGHGQHNLGTNFQCCQQSCVSVLVYQYRLVQVHVTTSIPVQTGVSVCHYRCTSTYRYKCMSLPVQTGTHACHYQYTCRDWYQCLSQTGTSFFQYGISVKIGTYFSQYGILGSTSACHYWYSCTDRYKVFTVQNISKDWYTFFTVWRTGKDWYKAFKVWYIGKEWSMVFTVSCMVYQNRSAQGFHSMVDWQPLSLSVYQYRSVQGFHSMAYQCYKVFAVHTGMDAPWVVSISNGANGPKSKKGKLLFDSNEIIMSRW